MQSPKIVNLTQHSIVVMDDDNNVIVTYYPDGTLARVSTVSKVIGEIDGITVSSSTYGAVEGLPDEQEGVLFIVSMMVAQALPHRFDLICPDTSPLGAVRDEVGRIIGTKGFQTFSKDFLSYSQYAVAPYDKIVKHYFEAVKLSAMKENGCGERM